MQCNLVPVRSEPLDQRLRTCDTSEIDGCPARRLDLAVVKHGALPPRGKEKFAGHRHEHRREHGRLVFNQRHAHAPVLAPGEIAAGAVDRIDNPGQPPAQPLRIINAFLRQPAIVGSSRPQPRLEQVVDRDVGQNFTIEPDACGLQALGEAAIS